MNDRLGYVRAADLAGDLMATAQAAFVAMRPHMAEEAARQEAEAREAEAQAAVAVTRESRARLRRADVPEKHEDRLLATGAEGVDLRRPLLVQAAAWHAGNTRTLVLGGSVGVGKTLTACWLLSQGPRRPFRNPNGDDTRWPAELHPRFVKASRLARLDTYKNPELGLIERCCVLVVDEVGGGDVGVPDSWRERLDMLASTRYDAGLDTVMTGNLSQKDFREMFGERLYDRVTGHGGKWIEIIGRSLRQPRRSGGEGATT